MADILIGTCGYSYNEWVGPVYPPGTKQKEFLGLYAAKFRTVELDYAFYGMPKPENLAKMLVSGGPNLTFSIKAFRELTHEVNPDKWKEVAETYLQAIAPLREASPGHPGGRLEAVLFQFPYAFHCNEKNRAYLTKLMSFFKGVPAAVEFRGSDWYNGNLIDVMKKRKIPLVSLDMPELSGLPPLMDVVTAETAYIRLHGRNKETWWRSDKAAQYDYLYTDSEIEAWVARIERIAEQAHRILVYFNNHPRGKAAQNAITLEKLLKKAGLIQDTGGKGMQNAGTVDCTS